MKCRSFEEDDYPVILQWAQERQVAAPPLPGPKHKLVVEEEDHIAGAKVLLASCWMLQDDAARIALPHYLFTCPGLSLEESRKVIAALLTGVEDAARDEGMQLLSSMVHGESALREAVNVHDWLFLGTGYLLWKPL